VDCSYKRTKWSFGLVAEDQGNGKFRGFFTIDSKIIEKVIKIINNTMRIEINFSK